MEAVAALLSESATDLSTDLITTNPENLLVRPLKIITARTKDYTEHGSEYDAYVFYTSAFPLRKLERS